MATDKEILEAAAKHAAWIIKLEAKVQELENICSQTNYGREALLLLEKK
jgi:hypothetical protein